MGILDSSIYHAYTGSDQPLIKVIERLITYQDATERYAKMTS